MGIYLLILFIIIPIIEIYLFILIGGEIGIISTLLVVILTAVVGTYLLRIQGLVTLQKAQRMMEQGQMPAEALIEGILLLLAGAFLLTPGFFTDGVGFILLFPFTRGLIARYIIGHVHVSATTSSQQSYEQQHWQRESPFENKKTGSTIIDGEYKREDD